MKLDFQKVFKIHDRKKQQYSLREVTTSFKEQENVAIMAVNDRSSNAMLRLIAGIEAPTRGVIKRDGVFTGVVGESNYFHAELTGEANIRFICKIYGQDANQVIDEVIKFAGLKNELKQKTKSYNTHLRRKIAISISLLIESDTYLLSGALHYPQKPFHNKVQEKLAELSEQAAIIISTNDQNLMKQYATTSIVIDNNGYLQCFDDIQSGIDAHTALKEASKRHAI
ncbi:hypothetical protein EOL70_16865 [Leucothrix sargassi]|nr:hypothetical protein EOL70_16865 [Leucothrix sargassi]